MKRTLCIWLANWPIQRLLAVRPELKGKSVALYETHRGGRRVAVCSTGSRALGVVVGMPLAEANALASSLPRSLTRSDARGTNCQRPNTTLHLEPYDPPADRQVLEKLAACCYRFSPLVGLEDSPTPDSLLLDITGLEHLFGSEASLAAGIIHDFARRGFNVRVAVADTIGTAWAVAHFGQRGSAESGGEKEEREGSGFRVQGSEPPRRDLSSPDNCPLPTAHCLLNPSPFPLPPSAFVIPPGEASAALRPLPVEALRLPGDVVELLHQLGIYQIGQVESLPREDLASRFGPQLVERLDQATGRLAEPVAAHQLPPQLAAQWSLEHPTTRRETVELVLEQLIGRVAGMLFRCGRGAVQLQCRLACESAANVDLSVGLFQATASARHLFQLVRMRLERISLPAAVSAVHVRAAATAPLARRQQELFSGAPLQDNPRHLADLVDRLSSRLGGRSVVRARLLHDAQPELAYQYDPLVGDSSGRHSRCGTSSRVRGADLPPRPLRLERRPIPLAVVSIMPDGPPVGFHLGNRQHRISRVWGPERIETGWWRGRPVGRDYYRIETISGGRYWLFRRLRDGKWFLHGTFE